MWKKKHFTRWNKGDEGDHLPVETKCETASQKQDEIGSHLSIGIEGKLQKE